MFCSNCGKEIDDKANFCQFCGSETNTLTPQLKNNETQSRKKNSPIIFFIVFIILFALFGGFREEGSRTPRNPKDLECVPYKNLCIATTDVKYDYTSVQSRDPRYYNSKWNNGWQAAQNACKSWGGRLPYMEEFPTILEACFDGKIKLEDNRTYLSSTEINWHRIYAFSNSWVASTNKKYDKKNIYDYAASISKSADWKITGDYSTSEIYDWKARCVKSIK